MNLTAAHETQLVADLAAAERRRDAAYEEKKAITRQFDRQRHLYWIPRWGGVIVSAFHSAGTLLLYSKQEDSLSVAVAWGMIAVTEFNLISGSAQVDLQEKFKGIAEGWTRFFGWALLLASVFAVVVLNVAYLEKFVPKDPTFIQEWLIPYGYGPLVPLGTLVATIMTVRNQAYLGSLIADLNATIGSEIRSINRIKDELNAIKEERQKVKDRLIEQRKQRENTASQSHNERSAPSSEPVQKSSEPNERTVRGSMSNPDWVRGELNRMARQNGSTQLVIQDGAELGRWFGKQRTAGWTALTALEQAGYVIRQEDGTYQFNVT